MSHPQVRNPLAGWARHPKLVFGVVAAALLVVYLVTARVSGGDPAGDAAPPPGASAPGTVVLPPEQSSGPIVDQTTGLPLPLTGEQIRDAADVAHTFATRYGSYRYDQDDQRWVASLRELLAPDGALDAARLAPSGAAKAQLVADKQVTTATVTDTRIGLMSKTSIMFTLTVQRKISSTGGERTRSDVYEVAVVRDKTGWAVADIQPSGGATGGPD